MTKDPRSFRPGAVRRLSRAPGFVPVEAKLLEPEAQDRLVPRGTSIDLLRESFESPIVLVTAPPGYGKTALVRQWADEDERPFAWLSLDATDNDPLALVIYIVLALQRIEEVEPGSFGVLSGDTDHLRTVVLPRLGRWLWQRRHSFVLVLDNADAITAPEALDVLLTIVEHMPQRSQLVLIARQSPDLPWSQLRAGRRLFELGPDDLRLNRAETEALLEASGTGFTADDATDLLNKTEGWAAGVYLSTLAAHENRTASKSALNYATPLIATYFRDEMLARLSEQQQSLLIRCSILDRMCASLCDALLSSDDATEVLRELAGSNSFVAAVDTLGEWYRVHHMFREMLLAELHQREPDAERALHARASRWLEAHGDPDAAVDHAIAAGETEQAARLIWAQVPVRMSAGQPDIVAGWLRSFTSGEITSHAKLALAMAWCAASAGRPVEPWLAASEDGVYDAERPGEPDSIASGTALLRAYTARHGVVQMGADARFSQRLQAPGDPWWGLTQFIEAVARHLTGHRDEAKELLEQTAQLAADLGAHGPHALALSQLAVLAVENDDWQAALAATDTVMALDRDHGLQLVPLMAPAFCVVPLVLAKAGRVEEARLQARQSTRAIALMPQLPPWFAVQARYLLARAHLILGDTVAARVLLSEAQLSLPFVPDASDLRERLEGLWEQIEKFPLGVHAGISTLTTAELRILQLLPTHLSFEQIGRRLFISRNTVKTEAIAAYRKLGVSSRAEAVEHARALGML